MVACCGGAGTMGIVWFLWYDFLGFYLVLVCGVGEVFGLLLVFKGFCKISRVGWVAGARVLSSV